MIVAKFDFNVLLVFAVDTFELVEGWSSKVDLNCEIDNNLFVGLVDFKLVFLDGVAFDESTDWIVELQVSGSVHWDVLNRIGSPRLSQDYNHETIRLES